MINNPKFDKYINSKIKQNTDESSRDRFGIIMEYNKFSNTATVVLSSPHSEEVGDIIREVPCPVAMGVQTAAPEAGRPCWVVFKGNTGEQYPMITHYFNHNYLKYDYEQQSAAKSGIPFFMTGM